MSKSGARSKSSVRGPAGDEGTPDVIVLILSSGDSGGGVRRLNEAGLLDKG